MNSPSPTGAVPDSQQRGGLLRPFINAGRGLLTLFREERNARIHLLAAVLVIAAGVWLALTPIEWAIVTLVIAQVGSAEALNSAIERLTDLVSPEMHPLAGAAKDLAAAAVLLTAIGSLIVAACILARAW